MTKPTSNASEMIDICRTERKKHAVYHHGVYTRNHDLPWGLVSGPLDYRLVPPTTASIAEIIRNDVDRSSRDGESLNHPINEDNIRGLYQKEADIVVEVEDFLETGSCGEARPSSRLLPSKAFWLSSDTNLEWRAAQESGTGAVTSPLAGNSPLPTVSSSLSLVSSSGSLHSDPGEIIVPPSAHFDESASTGSFETDPVDIVVPPSMHFEDFASTGSFETDPGEIIVPPSGYFDEPRLQNLPEDPRMPLQEAQSTRPPLQVIIPRDGGQNVSAIGSVFSLLSSLDDDNVRSSIVAGDLHIGRMSVSARRVSSIRMSDLFRRRSSTMSDIRMSELFRHESSTMNDIRMSDLFRNRSPSMNDFLNSFTGEDWEMSATQARLSVKDDNLLEALVSVRDLDDSADWYDDFDADEPDFAIGDALNARRVSF